MFPSTTLPPSHRALANLTRGQTIDFNNEIIGKPMYDPIHQPNGLISVSGAENRLMIDFTNESVNKYSKTYDMTTSLGYGGVTGPPELSEAMSRFINKYFNPSTTIEAKHILPTNGVSSVLDMVAFNTCEVGDGIMVITPTYSMYEIDLCARAEAVMVEVSSVDIQDQFKDVYAQKLLANFRQAFDDATGRGIVVKAMLLCNPSNPQGRCYSHHTLTEIAKFCGQRGLHLFADEIYAMSVFEPVEDDYKLDDFTSVLSLPRDEKNGIFPENIHSMYGASKDFCMGGLRLGFLVTRNEQFWKTCRRTALFTWITPFSASFFTAFISDENAMEEYLITYRSRLRQRYIEITQLFKAKGIPHDPANSGLFVWIDLNKWLCYFNGTDKTKASEKDKESREEQLYRYILSRGVVLNLGEESKSSSPGRFRFVYTGPENWAQLAIERISEALSDLETKE